MEKSRKGIIKLSIIAAVLLLLGAWTLVASAEKCSEGDQQRYICDLNHPPEDLLHITGTNWIIASGMGAPGSLYVIDTTTKSSKKLTVGYPQDWIKTAGMYKDCLAPLNESTFSPHGINARFDKNGQQTLYVVNHGERESIEIFDLTIGLQGPKIVWVGCVVMPEKTSPNSVVPTPNGGLAVTSIFDPTDKNLQEKILGGETTGKILEWSDLEGWSVVPGSELPGNNGLQISSDGQWYYVSAWFGRTLTKLSRHQEKVQLETIDLDFLPDNIRWSDDGNLLVAGHGTTLAEFYQCAEKAPGCAPDSTIIQVDPRSLRVQTLFKIPGNTDFSTASVAVRVGNEIFLGTFAKDRIAFSPAPLP